MKQCFVELLCRMTKIQLLRALIQVNLIFHFKISRECMYGSIFVVVNEMYSLYVCMYFLYCENEKNVLEP